MEFYHTLYDYTNNGYLLIHLSNTHSTITTKDRQFPTIDAYWIKIYNHGNNININELTFHELIDDINKYKSNTTTSTFKTLLQSYFIKYMIEIHGNAVNRN